MADRIQLRRDVAANWTSANPILAQGELGLETDTLRIKIGNGTDNWTTLPYYTTNNDTFSISAARNHTNCTNIYLRSGDGTPTNISPFIIPFSGKIVAICAATNGVESWTAEVHKNNTLIPSASLSVSATDYAFNNTFDISVSAGDKISLYCNGTGINNPRILVLFQK